MKRLAVITFLALSATIAHNNSLFGETWDGTPIEKKVRRKPVQRKVSSPAKPSACVDQQARDKSDEALKLAELTQTQFWTQLDDYFGVDGKEGAVGERFETLGKRLADLEAKPTEDSSSLKELRHELLGLKIQLEFARKLADKANSLAEAAKAETEKLLAQTKSKKRGTH